MNAHCYYSLLFHTYHMIDFADFLAVSFTFLFKGRPFQQKRIYFPGKWIPY